MLFCKFTFVIAAIVIGNVYGQECEERPTIINHNCYGTTTEEITESSQQRQAAAVTIQGKPGKKGPKGDIGPQVRLHNSNSLSLSFSLSQREKERDINTVMDGILTVWNFSINTMLILTPQVEIQGKEMEMFDCYAVLRLLVNALFLKTYHGHPK